MRSPRFDERCLANEVRVRLLSSWLRRADESDEFFEKVRSVKLSFWQAGILC